MVVIKHDGSRQAFNRQKILNGILRASTKTSLTRAQAEQVTTSVVKALQDRNKKEVKTQLIGSLVVAELAKTNKVTYVRFVSVYRRFKTLAGFEKELSALKKD